MENNTFTDNVINNEPPKKKKSKKAILLLLPAVAFIIIAILLLAPTDESSGEANLGFTLAEFVESYNSTVDAHLYQDTTAEQHAEVKEMLKLDVEYFLPVEEYDDTFVASNGSLEYMVIMDESGEKVQAISFAFTNDINETQFEMLLTFCKWFAEAVKPDMGETYYTETLTKAIENGNVREEGIAYYWKTDSNFYRYEIYYAA